MANTTKSHTFKDGVYGCGLILILIACIAALLLYLTGNYIIDPVPLNQDLNNSSDSTNSTNEKTLGQEEGTYKPIHIKTLEGRLIDYATEKAKVSFTFEVIEVEFNHNYGRLNLRPSPIGKYGTSNIDIIVRNNNPLYDQIVDLHIGYCSRTMVTLWGTVSLYSNSYDSAFVTPDKLVFTLKQKL